MLRLSPPAGLSRIISSDAIRMRGTFHLVWWPWLPLTPTLPVKNGERERSGIATPPLIFLHDYAAHGPVCGAALGAGPSW
ncbi:hypothetical protein BRAS3809_190004 [Bradyrhizobium sp. STM 3809]|nr:hypothetical protein BRAS3809_190004 [Bradyrhizobium sp. STM 3809]